MFVVLKKFFFNFKFYVELYLMYLYDREKIFFEWFMFQDYWIWFKLDFWCNPELKIIRQEIIVDKFRNCTNSLNLGSKTSLLLRVWLF